MKKIVPIETTPQEFCDKFMRTLEKNSSAMSRRYSLDNSRMCNGVPGRTGADIYLQLFEGDETCLGVVSVGAPSEELASIVIPRALAEPIIQRCMKIEEGQSQEAAENAYKKL